MSYAQTIKALLIVLTIPTLLAACGSGVGAFAPSGDAVDFAGSYNFNASTTDTTCTGDASSLMDIPVVITATEATPSPSTRAV